MNSVSLTPPCVFGDVNVRYASSTQRIYLESSIEGDSCVTLSDIIEKFPSAPVSEVSPGIFFLEEDLYVLDGVTLSIKDVELRLKSDNTTYINLRAHGGSINIENSKVHSWDSSINGPDENIEDGRSYISAISEIVTDTELVCNGQAKNTMGESRLDISNSEISYLGYYESESWGITMKVRGFCSDKSNPEVMDLVGVYGNIVDSEIHHMYHGHYSYGHRNGEWSRNIVHDNIGYGFDPHDYSRNATIEDNVVYNNGIHGIIGSKWCTNLHIRRNTVYNSKVGIFLHVLSNDAIVEDNEVYDNLDSGIVFLESAGGLVRNNNVYGNVIGTRISVGSNDLVFEGNVFENNGEREVYTYEGTDDLTEMVSNSPSDVLFLNNIINGNEMKFSGSSSIQFIENKIDISGEIVVDDSDQILFLDNEMVTPNLRVTGDSCFSQLSDFGEPLCENKDDIKTYDSEIVSMAPTPTTREISFSSSPTGSPTGSPIVSFTDSPTGSPTGFQTDSPSSGIIFSSSPSASPSFIDIMVDEEPPFGSRGLDLSSDSISNYPGAVVSMIFVVLVFIFI